MSGALRDCAASRGTTLDPQQWGKEVGAHGTKWNCRQQGDLTRWPGARGAQRKVLCYPHNYSLLGQSQEQPCVPSHFTGPFAKLPDYKYTTHTKISISWVCKEITVVKKVKKSPNALVASEYEIWLHKIAVMLTPNNPGWITFLLEVHIELPRPKDFLHAKSENVSLCFHYFSHNLDAIFSSSNTRKPPQKLGNLCS